MIFWQIFYTFLLIGAFTFGGGYSMVALIQNEVVVHHGWMTAAEFTDLLAVSQMTPGPVGINTATYAGYRAVIGAGYPQWAAVCGSLLASLAVVMIPVALVLLVGSWILSHKDNTRVASVMRTLRLVALGLIAAAALMLLTTDNFGTVGLNRRFIMSVAVFVAVFLLRTLRRTNPILLILGAGLAGLLLFSVA